MALDGGRYGDARQPRGAPWLPSGSEAKPDGAAACMACDTGASVTRPEPPRAAGIRAISCTPVALLRRSAPRIGFKLVGVRQGRRSGRPTVNPFPGPLPSYEMRHSGSPRRSREADSQRTGGVGVCHPGVTCGRTQSRARCAWRRLDRSSRSAWNTDQALWSGKSPVSTTMPPVARRARSPGPRGAFSIESLAVIGQDALKRGPRRGTIVSYRKGVRK